MSTIFVTGHRNPDMDSIAAAISYSALKNELDSGNHYIPVALGPLNTQSHAMLESLGLPDPLFVKDVYSRVSAVYRKPTLTVAPDDPVYELVNMYNQNNPSVVPIMDGSVFKGLLSIDEINTLLGLNPEEEKRESVPGQAQEIRPTTDAGTVGNSL